jgi:uncharacterized protein YuzE
MNSVRITYDAEGDILYIAFGHSREATGYQLSDQILLRMDPGGDGPAGLTIFNFLHHVGSESGIGIGEVEDTVMKAISSEPISRFLEMRTAGGRVSVHLLEPSLRESISAVS